VSAWVSALGPDGGTGELTFTGRRPLAEAVLEGFANAGVRRSAAAA
jgi:hypothetical protein